MKQLLLFPDERPLVERLGTEFFQRAPECPGVYLMRSAANEVLYVGKAKNLRKRLRNYRVANPDRMGRRHLRLLNSATRIEFQECESEASALAKETSLLRNLRPRFNRAGTWPSAPQYVIWRVSTGGFELGVTRTLEPGWAFLGPLGSGALPLRALLLRVLWCAMFPERGLVGMPQGWFHGRCGEVVTIPRIAGIEHMLEQIADLWDGRFEQFETWLQNRAAKQLDPFEVSARKADIELLKEIASVRNQGTS